MIITYPDGRTISGTPEELRVYDPPPFRLLPPGPIQPTPIWPVYPTLPWIPPWPNSPIYTITVTGQEVLS